MRYVGDTTDASLSALTLYKGMYFAGDEVLLQEDSSNTVSGQQTSPQGRGPRDGLSVHSWQTNLEESFPGDIIV